MSLPPLAGRSGAVDGLSFDAVGDLVAQLALFHPAHGEQVLQEYQAIEETIMAAAGVARLIDDFDFTHAKAFHLDQRRHEAMHPVKRHDVRRALAPKCPESASGIAHLIAAQPVAHPVADARGEHAQQIVAVFARADPAPADAIIMSQRLHETGDFRRIVLQIGVHRDYVFAASRLDSRPYGGGFAAIEGEALHPQTRLLVRQFLEQLPRSIGAAIVGNHDLIGQFQRIHGGANPLQQDRQIALFVIAGDYDTEAWSTQLRPANSMIQSLTESTSSSEICPWIGSERI